MAPVPESSEAICRLARRLHRFLRRHRLLDGDGGVLIAVSGGTDSTALALATAALARESALCPTPVIAHVDHAQSADSSVAAAAVAAFASRLELPFATCRLPLAVGAGEAQMRSARYAALGELAARAGAHCVLTAHHRDDQIETILLRTARGTGLRGLCGMPPLRSLDDGRRLARPFLGLPRAVLADAVRDAGHWPGVALDPSNDDLRFARNALRANLLPRLLATHGRARLDRLARDAARRRRRFDRLDARAAAWIAAHVTSAEGTLVVPLAPWPTWPPLATTILQHLFQVTTGGWPLRGWLLRALAFAGGRAGRQLDAHRDLRLTKGRDHLVFRCSSSAADGPPLRTATTASL